MTFSCCTMHARTTSRSVVLCGCLFSVFGECSARFGFDKTSFLPCSGRTLGRAVLAPPQTGVRPRHGLGDGGSPGHSHSTQPVLVFSSIVISMLVVLTSFLAKNTFPICREHLRNEMTCLRYAAPLHSTARFFLTKYRLTEKNHIIASLISWCVQLAKIVTFDLFNGRT